jgi:hypothetical protein
MDAPDGSACIRQDRKSVSANLARIPLELYILERFVNFYLRPPATVEMASLPWSILAFSGDTGDTPGWMRLDVAFEKSLPHGGRFGIVGFLSLVCLSLSET